MPVFAIPFPAIDPVLIEVGPLAIRWYALAYVAGLLLGWYLARRLVANDRLWGTTPRPDPADFDDFLIYAALGIVLGGRLGYVIFYSPGYFLQNPLEVLQLWSGGMSFHGGLAGVTIAMILFARKKSYSAWTLFDVIGAVAPLGFFFGRIANFINAELYGRPSDVPWAMVFPGAGPEPRHPSQLYEAFFEGLVLYVLVRLATHTFGKLSQPGYVTGVFIVGYGIFRIFCEFFREPDAHIGFLAFGLTMGMILSVPMIIIGIYAIVRVERAARNTA